MRFFSAALLAATLSLGFAAPGAAQYSTYSPDWFDPAATYVKIGVAEDAVYRVTLAEIAAQAGASFGAADEASLRLLENGRDVPVWFQSDGAGGLGGSDAFVFVGRRNTGESETAWAFGGQSALRSSDYFSLYTDTTFYWLTWGGSAAGLRYAEESAAGSEAPVLTHTRADVRIEQDVFYYFGDSNDASQTAYTRGEGYYTHEFRHTGVDAKERPYTIEPPRFVRSADSAFVSLNLSSISGLRHRVTLEVRIDRGGGAEFVQMDEADWNGYAFRSLSAGFRTSEIPTDNDQVRVKITSHNEFNSQPNSTYLDFTNLDFPQALPTSDVNQALRPRAPGAYRFRWTESRAEAITILDPARARRATIEAGSASAEALVQTTPADDRVWAATPGAYRTPAAYQRPARTDYAAPSNGADYVIVTRPALRASAEALAAYRASQGLSALVVEQGALFDQFDYGRPTPIAIRRFVEAAQGWATVPQYFVFYGDTIRPEQDQARRSLEPWEVISFGFSPSDAWFAMLGDSWEEVAAVGRLPLRDNATGALFLEKVRRYESAPLEEWQKRHMLLVGGQTVSEQAFLQSRAIPWSDVAREAPFGADTLNFFKNASAPLDPTFQDSLSVAFERGAGWLAYFGHSAARSWEIVTVPPAEYDNADRLPVVVSVGCNTGNFAGGALETTNELVLAEELVLGSQNGSIAHWGSSSLSTITLPSILTRYAHDTVYRDTVRVLGEAFRQGKARMARQHAGSRAAYFVLLQYTLVGDPATRINLPVSPDLKLGDAALSISPDVPTPRDSTLRVDIRMRNQGLIPGDSVTVRLTHRSPSGAQATYDHRVAPIALDTLLTLRVPIRLNDVGRNTFEAVADADGVLVDAVPGNNTATREIVVFSNSLVPATATGSALVPERTPTLRATLALDADALPVFFELDTTPDFGSSSARRFETTVAGALAEWPIEDPLEVGTTYWWRARTESAPGLPLQWTTSSFTVSDGATGWLQQGELFEEALPGPLLSRNSRDGGGAWELADYTVRVRVTSERGFGAERGRIAVAGTDVITGGLGLGMIILDGTTGEIRDQAIMATYKLQPQFEASRGDSTANRIRLDEMIATMQPGDHVYMRTRNLGSRGSMEIQDGIKRRFRDLGSTAIDTLSYDNLWIFYTRVGFPEETIEFVEPVGSEFDNEIGRDFEIPFQHAEGTLVTRAIGPALEWESVAGQADLANAASSVRVDVLHASKDSVLLADVMLPGSASLAELDAAANPYVRLRATLTDTSQASTPQLTQWSLRFAEVAEIVLDPADFTLSADTLEEAQSLTATAAVRNLSARAVASEIVVRYYVQDAENREVLVGTDTLRGLKANTSVTTSLDFDTDGYLGDNRLRVEAAQTNGLEAIDYNNTAFRRFRVRADRDAPTITIRLDDQVAERYEPGSSINLQDPTFPFVSARPDIEIAIADENAFKLLADTSLIVVRLDGERLALKDLDFRPGTSDTNEALLLFTPTLTGRDTTHTLVVEAYDASGNEATNSPFVSYFRVQTDWEVPSLYPYPNPMGSFTRFAFQLRGTDPGLVDDCRVRIYSLSGRLVRELDALDDPGVLENAGALRIGWNKILWDGRDDDGDRVASGVYLYKVFLRADGEAVTVNGDGVEKVVVLR